MHAQAPAAAVVVVVVVVALDACHAESTVHSARTLHKKVRKHSYNIP